MKKVFKTFRNLLYVFLSGFLGIFGLANLAPNSTVGQATGQSVSTSNSDVTSSKKNAPDKIKTPAQQIADIRLGGSGMNGPQKKPVVWKPGKQQRKKHKNLLHTKHASKRKHRRKKTRG